MCVPIRVDGGGAVPGDPSGIDTRGRATEDGDTGFQRRRHSTELELRLVLGAGNICALSYLHMIAIRTIG